MLVVRSLIRENATMEVSKDDPQAFLFSCDACGAWPMAFETQYMASERKAFRFACPRCKAHAVKAKGPGRMFSTRVA